MAEFGKSRPETSRTIDETARRWAVRLDGEPLSEPERRELDAWLAGDVRCVGALARAQSIMTWTQQARALSSSYLPEAFLAPRAASRRKFLLWGGGIAATAGAAAAAIALMPRDVLYQTQKGEIRLIPLEDGSTATLNTQTRLSVDFASRRRAVALSTGEVFFQVVKAIDRPFLVSVENVLVRASGAAFVVSNLIDGPIRIVVRRGMVDILRTVATGTSRVKASANMEISIPRAGSSPTKIRTLDGEKTGDAFQWLEGKIVLQGTALREAARQFYRYSDFRIVVEDTQLANEPITGLFSANDPLGFCTAITSVLGAKMRVDGKTILLSPIH